MNSRYKLKIEGRKLRNFISLLIKEKIFIYDTEFYKDYLIIIVDEESKKKIDKIKGIYKITIIDDYGLIKVRRIVKEYKHFIISIFGGIILIIILSNMIFDVTIKHSKKEIRDLIKNDLELYGLKKYHFKISYKKKEIIKKKILTKEKEKIEWLEIYNIGTRYIVKVEERIKKEPKKDQGYRSIVAKKDAMILSITATKGEIKKKKFDYVKKGDVLISGIIMNKDRAVNKVYAKGKVYGEVWYTVNVEIPKKYNVREKTNRSCKRLELNFITKSVFLFGSKYKNYDLRRTIISSNKLLPISLNYTEIKEVIITNKHYNIRNIDKDAITIGAKKLMSSLNKKDVIIYKKVLKKTEKNSKILVEIFYKVKEDITDTESIDDIDLNKLNEQIEGE